MLVRSGSKRTEMLGPRWCKHTICRVTSKTWDSCSALDNLLIHRNQFFSTGPKSLLNTRGFMVYAAHDSYTITTVFLKTIPKTDKSLKIRRFSQLFRSAKKFKPMEWGDITTATRNEIRGPKGMSLTSNCYLRYTTTLLAHPRMTQISITWY